MVLKNFSSEIPSGWCRGRHFDGSKEKCLSCTVSAACKKESAEKNAGYAGTCFLAYSDSDPECNKCLLRNECSLKSCNGDTKTFILKCRDKLISVFGVDNCVCFGNSVEVDEYVTVEFGSVKINVSFSFDHGESYDEHSMHCCCEKDISSVIRYVKKTVKAINKLDDHPEAALLEKVEEHDEQIDEHDD